MTTAPPPSKPKLRTRTTASSIGYARVSTCGQDYQYQRDALAAAH